jgi:hypothetical protein
LGFDPGITGIKDVILIFFLAGAGAAPLEPGKGATPFGRAGLNVFDGSDMRI